mmetsp:Transcript_37633/g.72117  ORF Transcript_37633/g.72117 Transcript_37633/m.72117 type:complete len:464 (+) Transcript_37633:148-1539(+)
MHAWGGIWDPLNTDGQPCLEEQAARWLKALSMDMYTGQLLQQGVRSLEDMQYVSDDIMNVCGFNPIEKAKFIARRPDRRIREKSALISWVRRNKLEHCMETMLLQGIETLQDLCEAGESIQTVCGLEAPEKIQLRHILEDRLCRSSGGAQGTPALGSSPARKREMILNKADGTWNHIASSNEKVNMRRTKSSNLSPPNITPLSCRSPSGLTGEDKSDGNGNRRTTTEIVFNRETGTWNPVISLDLKEDPQRKMSLDVPRPEIKPFSRSVSFKANGTEKTGGNDIRRKTNEIVFNRESGTWNPVVSLDLKEEPRRKMSLDVTRPEIKPFARSVSFKANGAEKTDGNDSRQTTNEIVFNRENGTWNPVVSLEVNMDTRRQMSLDLPRANATPPSRGGSLGLYNLDGSGGKSGNTNQMSWCPATKAWLYENPKRTVSPLSGVATQVGTTRQSNLSTVRDPLASEAK